MLKTAADVLGNAPPLISGDPLPGLYKIRDSFLERFPGGAIVISDAMRQEWARENPRDAMEFTTARIDRGITERWKTVKKRLITAVERAETAAAAEPAIEKRRAGSARATAYAKTPEANAAAVRLEKAYARRDVMLEAGRHQVLTEAQRTARSDLAREIITLEIASREPRYQARDYDAVEVGKHTIADARRSA